MGRQDDKCKQPCENTIVYFGFPVLEEGLSGRLDRSISTKLCPLLTGFCEGNETGFAKIYLKQQVKVTKDSQAYTFLRYAMVQSFVKFKCLLKTKSVF